MAQIISDNFTRANANNLGANWTPWVAVTGPGDRSPEILSNQAATGSQTAHDSYAIYSGAGWTGGNDQYAELTVLQSTNASGLGPLARMTVGNNTDVTRGYMAYADTVGTSSSSNALRRVDDVAAGTVLGSFTATINVGDVVRVECQGTTIRMLVNGVVKVTATDATYASGNPGIFFGRDTTSGDSIGDNWAAGDFSVAQTFFADRRPGSQRPFPFGPGSIPNPGGSF